jgi:YD repeat-containing protein
MGHRLTETFADGGVIKYDYDQVGDLKSKVDQVGKETTYKFDARHRVIEEDQSTIGLKKTIDYNLTKPIVTSTESAVGETSRKTVMEYDRFQQLVKTTDAEGNIRHLARELHDITRKR